MGKKYKKKGEGKKDMGKKCDGNEYKGKEGIERDIEGIYNKKCGTIT